MTPNEPELVSWKEIASYLKVSVKTAQTWETQRGLPVRRLPGPRGQVRASIADLDAWCGQDSPSDQPADPPPSTSKRWRKRTIAIAAATVVAIALATASMRRPHSPSSARIEEHALVAFDAVGHELWRTPFSEAQNPLEVGSASRRRLWVGDLDGDGAAEILFGSKAAAPTGHDALICFAADGRERWRFLPGATVNSANYSYPPPYGIHTLDVTKIGGRTLIAVSSFQYPNAPAQVALLDQDGRLLGEYWHFGHLSQLLFADLDHRGQTLLYLAGVSNRDHAATLVVLNPLLLRGKRQASNLPFSEIEVFQETRRVIFPRSRLNELVAGAPYNAVAELLPVSDGLRVDLQERFLGSSPTLMYTLDANLRLKSLQPSDQFIVEHGRLSPSPSAGTIEEEVARLSNAYNH